MKHKHSETERHSFWLLSYSSHFCPAAHLISAPIDFLDRLSAPIPHIKPSTVSLPTSKWSSHLSVSPSVCCSIHHHPSKPPFAQCLCSHSNQLSICAWQVITTATLHDGLWNQANSLSKSSLSLQSPVLHMGATSQQSNRPIAKHTHRLRRSYAGQYSLKGWQGLAPDCALFLAK